jgi:hypothetical protein
MIKKIGLTLVLFISVYLLDAQQYDDYCGTMDISLKKFEKLPWIGNNQYLDNILDSVGYYSLEFDYDKILYRVPVKFWIYRKSDKTGGATEEELKNLMYDLNFHNLQNKTGFIYYMRPDIHYINSTRHTKMGYYLEAAWQSVIRHSEGCINVLIPEDLIKRTGKGRNYLKGTYNKVTEAVIITRSTSSTSLSHEIGHYFGLLHPHRNFDTGKCRQEAVDRTRTYKGCFKSGLICEQSGDGLCDTPAEPVLIDLVNQDCKYTGNLKDNWNDLYVPETENIMSYHKFLRCRTKFTNGQIAVMLYSANERNVEGWNAKLHPEYVFDEFEPDDSKETASYTTFNQRQYHTFNQIYMGKKKQSDDNKTDWIKFRIDKPVPSKVEIKTEIAKTAGTITLVTIYDSNENVVMKEQKTNQKGYSTVVFSNVREGWYFAKIERLNPPQSNSIYDYYITVFAK